MVGGYGAGFRRVRPALAVSLIDFGRLAQHVFRSSPLIFLVMTMGRRVPACAIRRRATLPPGWDPSQGARRSSPLRRRRRARVGHAAFCRRSGTLWVAYCLGTTAGTMVISQLVPFCAQRRPFVGGRGVRADGRRAWAAASGRVAVRVDVRLCPARLKHAGAVMPCWYRRAPMPLLFLFPRETSCCSTRCWQAVYYCYGTQLFGFTCVDEAPISSARRTFGFILTDWLLARVGGVAAIFGPFFSAGASTVRDRKNIAMRSFVAAAMSIARAGAVFGSFRAESATEQPVLAPCISQEGWGRGARDEETNTCDAQWTTMVLVGAFAGRFRWTAARAGRTAAIRLVPETGRNWPAGMYFSGSKRRRRPPAERGTRRLRRARPRQRSVVRRGGGQNARGSDESAGDSPALQLISTITFTVFKPRRQAGDGVSTPTAT